MAFFDKITGHSVIKICPEYLISDTYKSYFIFFSVARNFFIRYFFSYTLFLSPFTREERDKVVGRVVDGKSDDPGSSLAAANFFVFFFFNLPHLQKAKKAPQLRKADLCCQKKPQKSSAFCGKYTT